jgi:hypothetical protein
MQVLTLPGVPSAVLRDTIEFISEATTSTTLCVKWAVPSGTGLAIDKYEVHYR